MNTRTLSLLAGLSLAASSALAVNYNIQWMSLAPTPFNSPPPYTGTYNLPGVGLVTMTYNAHADFTEARFQNAILDNGVTSFGGNGSTWGNYECLARTNWGYSGVLNSPWSVTYTFQNTIPAGTIALGVSGLGRRNPNANENPLDCITRATVNQNGTFLGDWVNGNYGPTLWTGGAGTFNMRNTLTGAGGQDPWWNTYLCATRIDDPISSLTVFFDQTVGDGVGVNIGVLTPAPGSAALLGMGGLCLTRRRR